MDAFGKESHLCLQNQSFSVPSSFKMHSVMVCLKVNNYINGEIIFHLKRILKKLSYYNKIIVKFRAKNIWAWFYHAPNILLRGMRCTFLWGAHKAPCISTRNTQILYTEFLILLAVKLSLQTSGFYWYKRLRTYKR